MKFVSFYLAACLLAVFQFSCTKPGKPEIEAPRSGKVTPVGTPDGSPKTEKRIGAAGGSISTADGSIRINIPAGALSTEQLITIEPISNENPMGLKKAYRLTPHAVQFATPVSITFQYEDEDIAGSLPEALGIAYQHSSGVWMAVENAVLDKTAKTVTVTTTHFSDWSFFESFKLETSATELEPKGTARLELISDADLLAPLTPNNERPIGEPIATTGSFIREWSLAGAGMLAPLGHLASYTAPATVPGSPNPVAISVRVDFGKKGTYLVVAHIKITGDDGEIEVRVNGGGWVKLQASAVVKTGDRYLLADANGDEMRRYVFVEWTGGVGTHGFRPYKATSGPYAHYLITGGNQYVCYYMKVEDLATSGGGVTITSMGETDGYIQGSFDISSAGYGPELRQTHHVEGRFRVRKSW
ncbi:hypothetical protein [Chitinophaga lutea]|nr:hypothetical protein [Chitinophaga lutea]